MLRPGNEQGKGSLPTGFDGSHRTAQKRNKECCKSQKLQAKAQIQQELKESQAHCHREQFSDPGLDVTSVFAQTPVCSSPPLPFSAIVFSPTTAFLQGLLKAQCETQNLLTGGCMQTVELYFFISKYQRQWDYFHYKSPFCISQFCLLKYTM